MTTRLCALAFAPLLAALLATSPFARAEDPVEPAQLRAEAQKMREQAADLALNGNEHQKSFAQFLKEYSVLLAREAELREQSLKARVLAAKLKESGAEEEARKRQTEAIELLAEAEVSAAERREMQRMRDLKQRFRQQLAQLNDRSRVLRTEGRLEEAEKIDAEIRDLMRNHDPQLRRGYELKRRALETRLDGQHADADLFEREANRLLEVVATRYAPPLSTGQSAEAQSAGPPDKELREEVARLAQQVEALTKIVERLSDQTKP
jgi:hypothetical protein